MGYFSRLHGFVEFNFLLCLKSLMLPLFLWDLLADNSELTSIFVPLDHHGFADASKFCDPIPLVSGVVLSESQESREFSSYIQGCKIYAYCVLFSFLLMPWMPFV